MSLPNDIKNENINQRCRRFFYNILSFSSRINPCPSCPYECENKKYIGGDIRDEIVGCSRWP